MVKLPRDELDFLKKNDDMNDSKKDGKFYIPIIVHSFHIELIVN
jgi:hypothetical protein